MNLNSGSETALGVKFIYPYRDNISLLFGVGWMIKKVSFNLTDEVDNEAYVNKTIGGIKPFVGLQYDNGICLFRLEYGYKFFQNYIKNPLLSGIYSTQISPDFKFNVKNNLNAHTVKFSLIYKIV